MSDRRKLQSYEHLPHYLTDPIWDVLTTGTRERAVGALLQHAWQLGLRCPSEQTFSTLHNLMELARERKQPTSAFERYQAVATLKCQWKKYKSTMKQQDHQYHEYVETLPRDTKDLPAGYYLVAFSEHELAPCRIPVDELLMAVGATKLRWSKKSDEKPSSASSGGSDLQLVELAFRLGQSSSAYHRQDSGELSQPAFPRRSETPAPSPLPLEEPSMFEGFLVMFCCACIDMCAYTNVCVCLILLNIYIYIHIYMYIFIYI
ncbi:unnamed protein product [Durusdinium trenchii]|uniref:Uncharacterized protein n=1 Tax=Durusdinium trenchii TaxID=1381693 RepID=A0ABP0QLJ2_9DINO